MRLNEQQVDGEGQYVEIEKGFALPEYWTATHPVRGHPVNVELDLRVVDGRVQCYGVHFIGRGGKPVPAAALRRFALTDFIEEAVTEATMHDRGNPDGWVQEWANGGAVFVRPIARRFLRLGHPYTDELLREVAVIYERNAEGTPTKAVARSTGVSLPTAQRMVRTARERGLLKASAPRRRRAR